MLYHIVLECTREVSTGDLKQKLMTRIQRRELMTKSVGMSWRVAPSILVFDSLNRICNLKRYGLTISLDTYNVLYWLPFFYLKVCFVSTSILTRITFEPNKLMKHEMKLRLLWAVQSGAAT